MFENVHILVVGDVMLDRYWFGNVERISPEAPVPVITVEHSEERAGGAANVAANIAALGAQCTLLSVIGNDDAGTSLAGILGRSGITPVLTVDDQAETTVKLRILSKNQQLLRADFEKPPAHEVLGGCLQQYKQQLPVVDLVLISDYGKGGLYHIKEMISAAAGADKPVIVDPKGVDFSRYCNASMITPNLKEFERVVGSVANEQDLGTKAVELIGSLGITSLLVTKGEQGMSLYFEDGKVIHREATERDVYDVSGAGDTVISACAVATAAGWSHENMLQLANAAAGVVVGKLGAATASFEEVAGLLDLSG